MFTTDDWPRRGALGTLLASGLALFGLSKSDIVGAAKKKNKKKKKPPAKLTLLITGVAEFNVEAGGVNQGLAMCPPGSSVVSGLYTMTNPNCAPVLLGVVFDQAASGWQLTVQCPAEQSSANNTVQALCLKGATLGT